MNNLDKLVPPHELCRQIPEGAFADSALVWWGACVYPRRHIDGARCGEPYRRPGALPAPTPVEIVEALENHGRVYTQRDDDGWMVMLEIAGDDEGYGYDAKIERDTDNPATAALKLWMEMNKKENL